MWAFRTVKNTISNILIVGGSGAFALAIASLFAERLPSQKENRFTHIFSLVTPGGWALPTI